MHGKRRLRINGPTADAALAGVLFVAGQIEAWGGLRVGGDGARLHHSSALQALVALLATVPLVARRRAPVSVALVVAIALAVQVLAVVRGVSFLAGLLPLAVMVYSVAAYGAPRCRSIGLAALLAAAVLASVRVPEMHRTGEILFSIFALTSTWLLGDAARRHRGHADRHAAEARRLADERDAWRAGAVAEERSRIARELHDVVAHSVSLMGVQAGAARIQLDTDKERAREALLAIETTARDAVQELRRLLDILREHPDGGSLTPQPGMAEIRELVAQVRAAGQPVTLKVEGTEVPVPPGVALAAYRIVQEALTNTIKHARARHAEVRIAYAAQALELMIVDDGAAAASGTPGGHGLIGLHERAALYGGSLEAGPRGNGGFSVRARLPCEAAGR